MRFTIKDWLLFILASIAASLAMAGACWATWAAMDARRAFHLHQAVALALSLLAAPLNALAAWPVLRRCVGGLRFTPWLGHIALGAALAGFVSLPALAHAVLLSGVGPGAGLSAAKSPSGPVGWLPVAAYIVALLPPGLLLQRLTGASAWLPLALVTAAMAAIPLVWSGHAIHLAVPYATLVEITFLPVKFFAGATAVHTGVLTGLVLGAGLFLLARLPRSAAAP